MFYPEEIVEDVRERNDIVDVISSYIRLQKKGGNHMGLCPFHNEKTPSFSVSQSKQLYHCFGCGVGGNVFTFIMEYENYNFDEAIKFLADRAGVHLPEGEYSEEERKRTNLRERLFEVNKEAAKYFYYQLRSNRGKYAYDYLRKREIDDGIIQSFGLGFANQLSNDLYHYLKGKDYEDEFLKISGLVHLDEKRGGLDKFWNRVIFPIIDANNRVIGFGGRVMGDGMPKYLNSPETMVFDKSRNLYGINFAKKSRENYFIICEGYLDVIALNQAGFTNAVASLGTAFTEQQALLLRRYVRDVHLAYDSDGAGTKAALKAIHILKGAGISTKIINLLPYKDPDEFIKKLGVEEFQNRIRIAKGGFYFEIDVLARGYNMDDPEHKTKFYRELAKMFLQFHDELERNIYIEAVAKEYDIDFRQLQQLVHRAGANISPEPYVRLDSKEVQNKAEDSIAKAQRLLLTWLIERENLFNEIRPFINSKDFTEGIYSQVANYVFEQYELGNKVIPAKIINNFESMEEQSIVTSLFTADLNVDMQEPEFEKALKEIIIRIKENSLELQSNNAIEKNNAELLQQLILERVNLDKINIKLS